MTTFKRYTGTDWEYVNLPVFNSGPAATIGYAEVTANQTTISTEVDLTGLLVNVVVPAGRRIRISGQVQVQSATTSGTVLLRTKEGGTTLQTAQENYNTIGGNGKVLQTDVIISPSAGSHTYKFSLQGTAGTIDMTASASVVAFILVEDVTGSTLPYNPASVPVGVIAQTSRTTDFDTVGTNNADTMSLNIAVPAGRVLRAHWYEPNVFGTVTADNFLFSILQDGVQIQNAIQDVPAGNDNLRSPHLAVVFSPSAGAHTYIARCVRTSGTGSLKLTGAVGAPAQFWIEDITPTPAPGTGAPGSTLGYAQITANQAITSSNTDITGLSVTVNVPAGRRIRVSAFGEVQNTQGGINYVVGRILEGATQLQEDIVPLGATGGNNQFGTVTPNVVLTPTAGMHTYKVVGAAQTVGSTWLGSTQAPSYILVEDITGAIWPVGQPVTTGLFSSEPWSSWTPVVTQSVTPTQTLNRGVYYKLGRLVFCLFNISITGAGTASNAIRITNLPFAPATNSSVSGTAHYFDVGNTNFLLMPEFDSATAVVFERDGFGNLFGVGDIAVANGDGFNGIIIYEAAS